MPHGGSLVSVDVITLRYNTELRRVEVATRPRTTAPYLGVPALPGVLLREGMTIAIEPKVNIGGDETLQLEDGWTVITRDRTRSAHFEHTILIRNGPPEILTKRVERVV